MLKNYFKVAVRNLVKQRVFSLINIVGLALGLCCAILISLWINDELSYDQFHKKIDRLYISIAQTTIGDEDVYWPNTPAPLGDVIKDKIPGIEAACRTTWPSKSLFTYEQEKIEPEGIYVDSSFLKLFTFPLADGDSRTALTDPHSVVISQKIARELFPKESALGKVVRVADMDTIEQYTVTGVFEKLPEQTQLKFDYVMPFAPYYSKRKDWMTWGNYNEPLFILLEPEASFNTVDNAYRDVLKDYQKSRDFSKLHLYPFKNMRLRSDFSDGLANAGGRIEYVNIFTIVAIIIVLIACVNFMNLSTAKAGHRAKEVGIRKTTGARREMLVFQFLSESVLIAVISMLLAITLADVLMPVFNMIVEKQLSIPYANPYFIFGVLGISLFVGLLAGSYPALYLSGFQPVQILKGAKHKAKSFGGIRRVLVVIQFGLSIVLISCTVIIYNQIQYVMNKDLGIAKNHIISHDLNSIYYKKEAYINEVSQLPGVASITLTDQNPLRIGNSTWGVNWPGKGDGDVLFHVIQTGDHFIETFGLQLLEGKNFTYTQDTSKHNFILNEKAVRAIGFKGDPVGQEITVWDNKGKVIGVVKDFNHASLFKEIDPVIISQQFVATWMANIKLNGDQVKSTLADIENIYNKYEQEFPFSYRFLDQNVERSYHDVITVSYLANVFAIMAIFISCLGLFGLTAFMTEQRTKETGIRKVFGASVGSLTAMFSKDFLKLVLVAFVISVPVAFYAIQRWLEGFAYKVDIGVFPFLLAGVSALLIALLTVSYNTIKAALANPVDSLRQE